MASGTFLEKTWFRTGQRITECRKLRGLSREELVERIEALPNNNGKERSVKQIGYLENGTRQLSLEYAELLAEALQVKSDYLLLKSNFKTDEERFEDTLNKMGESASVLHKTIQLVANRQGCEIDVIDNSSEIIAEVDDIHYVIKKNGFDIAQMSVSQYVELRNEIFHYASYLFEKLVATQEKKFLSSPCGLGPEDIAK
jgi:transcriptional regulator with XRE-family HTH domain